MILNSSFAKLDEVVSIMLNRRLSQMRALQAGGRELDRNLWQLAPISICFWT